MGASEWLMSKNVPLTAATACAPLSPDFMTSLVAALPATTPVSATSTERLFSVRSAVSTLPPFQPSSSRREKLVSSRPGATRLVWAERRAEPSAPN